MNIKDTLDYFHMFMGFKITPEQFMEIINEDEELKEDLSGGYDTMNREWFMAKIAQKITGMDWPCFGDGQEMWDQFALRMRENGPKLGYNTKQFGLQ